MYLIKNIYRKKLIFKLILNYFKIVIIIVILLALDSVIKRKSFVSLNFDDFLKLNRFRGVVVKKSSLLVQIRKFQKIKNTIERNGVKGGGKSRVFKIKIHTSV